MTRTGRIAVLVAVVAAAVVAFLIARPEGERPPAPTATTGRPAPTKPHRTAPAGIRIVVRGGKPVGGVRKLQVERGGTVRFTVTSDAADEVHVHGYDLTRELRAGGSATLRFRARIDGVFEVELHRRHLKIAELRVTP